jgi:hypothetical protein
MSSVTFDFWSLPENYTKWFFEDAPEIYEWFISHGYSVYHDHTRNEVMVRSEDEEFEDIPFAFFATITINLGKLARV